MTTTLNPCKFCSERYGNNQSTNPTVQILNEDWAMTAMVICSCGTNVSISLPIVGNENREEMKQKSDAVSMVASMAWNSLNV